MANPVIDPRFRWNLAGKGCEMVPKALERQRAFVFTAFHSGIAKLA